MQFNDLNIGDKEFKLTTWTMTKQLQNQHVVMPLFKEPLVNAMALMSDEDIDESIFMAAVIDGVMQSLASVDMLKLAEILIDGVAIRASSGTMQPANIELLEKEGCDLSTVMVLCVNVIKQNYGALLKKDLADSLLGLTDGLNPQENPSSSNG